MSPTVVKASTARDLLRIVPLLAGVDPVESLVLVAFRGSRTSSAMRFTLPLRSGPAAQAGFAATAVAMLARVEGVDGVVPVVYTHRTFAAVGGLPFRALLERVRGRAEQAGLLVTDLLCVAGDAYGSACDPVLPREGRPLADLIPDDASALTNPHRVDPAGAIALPAVAAEQRADHRRRAARFAGLTEQGLDEQRHVRLRFHPDDRSALGLPATAVALEQAARAERRRAPERATDSPLERMERGDEPCALIERLLAPDGANDDLLAALAAMADRPPLRDVLLLQACWGPDFGRHAYRASVLAPATIAFDDAVVLALSGGDMPRPDLARVGVMIERLRAAAALTPPEHRPPLVTMLAWSHWALGRGSIAGALIDGARDVAPRYGFAELLDSMLGAGVLPAWAFREEPAGETGRRWLPRAGARPQGAASA